MQCVYQMLIMYMITKNCMVLGISNLSRIVPSASLNSRSWSYETFPKQLMHLPFAELGYFCVGSILSSFCYRNNDRNKYRLYIIISSNWYRILTLKLCLHLINKNYLTCMNNWQMTLAIHITSTKRRDGPRKIFGIIFAFLDEFQHLQ